MGSNKKYTIYIFYYHYYHYHHHYYKGILADERIKATLDKVPFVNTEYQWIEIEYRNHSVLVVLQSVFIYLEGADVTDASLSENEDLTRAIEIASKTNNLSAFVSNMIHCSKYVLQLNEGIPLLTTTNNDYDYVKLIINRDM